MTNVDTADAPAPEKEEKPKPKLVAVDFLDGDDNAEMAMDRKQWVNLPRDAKWIDHKWVGNKDRLGTKLRIKVRFDQEGSHAFKLKLKPDSENVVYSGAEKKRNTRYTFEEKEKSYTTDKDGTKIIENDFFIHVAGGSRWQAVAKDDEGNEAESHRLTAFRMIYVVAAKMKDVAAADHLDTLDSEFEKQGIVLNVIDQIEVKQITNDLTQASTREIIKVIEKGYKSSKGPAHEPYTVTMAFMGHAATKSVEVAVRKSGVTVGEEAEPVTFELRNGLFGYNYLWKDLAPDEEDWFVSCRYFPAPVDPQHGKAAGRGATIGGAVGGALGFAVGSAPGAGIGLGAGAFLGSIVGLAAQKKTKDTGPVDIDKEKCEPGAEVWVRGNTKVTVDVKELPKGVGTIVLKYNCVHTWAAGLEFGGTNIVAVCTKVVWEDRGSLSQNQTLIHEIGHKVHMVSDGTGKKPDKVKTLYTKKGHVGPHCHAGLEVKDNYLGVSGATCVMFGQDNNHSDFCDNCAPAVKKVDLHKGWTAGFDGVKAKAQPADADKTPGAGPADKGATS